MSDKFKAIVIDNQDEKFSREIKEINESDLKMKKVLIDLEEIKKNLESSYEP